MHGLKSEETPFFEEIGFTAISSGYIKLLTVGQQKRRQRDLESMVDGKS